MDVKSAARQATGKLFLVLAGCGALVVLIFVVLPWMAPPEVPPEPPQAMAPEEIVAEVLGEAAKPAGNEPVDQLTGPAEEDNGTPQDMSAEPVMPVPSPLMALRNDGEELPVVFPRREPEADEAEGVDDVLPPPLTPEEIEAALPEPSAVVAEANRPAGDMSATEAPGGPVPEAPRQLAATGEESPSGRTPATPVQVPTITAVQHPAGATPDAVREVQAPLEELGYDPGPVDGVWGERTAAAWRAFAAEAGGLAKALALAAAREPSDVRMAADVEQHQTRELVSAHQESRPPMEAASPSEEPSREAASGAAQAGEPPSGPPAQGVVMEGTLRGVMGYRMPLVSRQELPDQVVSGVLIPAHTTFVILKSGYWELTGVSPDDVEYLRDAAAMSKAEALAVERESEPQPVRRGWNPLRVFRRQAPGEE